MPEYLAPGVFVEEVSFRSKSIEGVSTSTAGICGLAAWGPVCYWDTDITGPENCEPRLITSFTEFERVYGGLTPLRINDSERLPYMAHAARAFFENGGKRLYVSRVYVEDKNTTGADAWGIARKNVVISDHTATWQARWPGKLGNMFIEVSLSRSKNLAYVVEQSNTVQLRGVENGSVVEVIAAGSDVPSGNDPTDVDTLRVVSVLPGGTQELIKRDGTHEAIDSTAVVQLVQLNVRVTIGSERVEEYQDLGGSMRQRRYIGRIMDLDDPEDQDCPVWLHWDPSGSVESEGFLPAVLIDGLRGSVADGTPYGERLEHGSDGGAIFTASFPDSLAGGEADPDNTSKKATGLAALGEIDDIAVVLAPDTGELGDPQLSRVAAQKLVTHAEKLKYRIAVVDGPAGSSLNQIRDFRAQFDSKYAAMYYPWIKVFDPNERFSQGTPPKQISLPPSGFVAGIYARNDITRGVHKAPANEVVRGLTRFELNINKPRQEVINPEGINALRFFEGRGYRVWGARTMSSDPEWKYVNVRRLFIFIEHSLDLASQWAVFEPNNSRLWDNVRRMIEDFLLVLWRDGALLGSTPEEAYFVRCDRTTMTQNDLDNGRLICLVGIAPVKPAEFVVFRVGQWTADSKV